MRVLFNKTDLHAILLREANKRLSLSITAESIIDLTFEEDDNGDVMGIAIEFDTPEAKAE